MAEEGSPETWYVRARGRILGPLTWEQLHALRDRGQLARFDQVSRDRQTWMPADNLERLFPRGGSAGAFVAGPVARPSAPSPARQAESSGFLILGDDDDGGGGPSPGPVIDLVTARPVPDEPAAWYYAEAGAPQGPVDYPELKRLARDGRVGPATLYWRSGLEQWTSGSDLAELNRLWPSEGQSGSATAGQSPPPGARGSEPIRPEAPPRVAPLAMVGIVSNLFCGVGNLAAIVVGVIALRQIARSGGTLAGKRQAIVGIAVGIAGLAAVALACYWLTARAAG